MLISVGGVGVTFSSTIRFFQLKFFDTDLNEER